MGNSFDWKREWEKTKKQLMVVSEQAAEMAKKGEKEVLRLSQKGKMRFESTTVALKKERICYLIGKAYLSLKDPSKPTAKFCGLVKEARSLDREQNTIEKSIKKIK